MSRFWRGAWLVLCCGLWPAFVAAEPAAALRVAVLEDAPPLGFRDASGQLTGFGIATMRALCSEMQVDCRFEPARLEHLIDDLVAGHFDVAAVGLLETPERAEKVVFTRPVYRSVTLIFAPRGVDTAKPGLRVSVFRGSAQEAYFKARGWSLISAETYQQMIEQLQAGVARGCVVPLMTSLSLQNDPRFRSLGLSYEALALPGLGGDAAFAIAPQSAAIKERLDRALEAIKRNGVYDRINSLFLPLRIN